MGVGKGDDTMKIRGHRITCALLAVVLILANIAPALADTQSGESTVYYESNIKPKDIGNYQFKVESHENPSHEWLPIVGKNYFPRTISTFNTEVDNTAPSATYKANVISKVDVIFAIGKLSQSEQLQNYIPTFTSKLNAAGNNVDAVVEQVETQDIDFSDEFLWDFVINGRKEQMSSGTLEAGRYEEGIDGKIIANGDTITFRGYGASPIYDYALFPSESDGKLVIEFTIKEVNADWHTLNYSGFNFGCAPGQPKSGYSVSFSRSSIGVRGNGINTSVPKPGGSEFSIEAVVDPKAGTIDVLVNDESVLSEQNIEFAGSQFGPFVQWGSHCCSSQSVVSFSGIKMQIDSKKSLGEALQDVSWRDGSARFIVHATDITPVEMEAGNDAMYQYTVTKLLNSNVYLINLGNSANKESLDKLLESLTTAGKEKKGTFYQNYPINSALNSSADYILDIVRKYAKPTDWVLVNTNIAWETLYKDQEKDLPLNFGEHDGTKNSDISDITLAKTFGVALTHLYRDDKIYAEKWRYRHFNTIYDNAPVIESFNGVWLEDPITLFANPGLFRINYKRRDNPFYSNVSLSYPFDSYRYWSTDYDLRVSDKK